MIKSKKSNLTPNKSEVDIPKSSIGFGAFEFFKNIARKYGIIRKPGNLPALIFLRFTGKRAEIKSLKPNCVISSRKYFTFHLSFYFKIIRQLMKLPGNRYQSYSNSLYYGGEQLKHLASDRLSVLHSVKVHDASREAFSGSTRRAFLGDTDYLSQLNYLNSFRQIIPNKGTSSQVRSGIPPIKRTGSNEDIFRTITPVEGDVRRSYLVTYPAHQSIILDTVSSHLSNYIYQWNIAGEPATGYLPFQIPLNRDTIIRLNPQNTAVSFVWRNFNIGRSTSQRTAIAPAEQKKYDWQRTESQYINVYNVVNTAFPRLVGISQFQKERVVKETYHAREAAGANSFSLISYPVYQAIKEPEHHTSGTGFFSQLISRQANLTLEHQNTAVGYLTNQEITMSYSNPMVVAIQRRPFISRIGGSVHHITALQDWRQTSDRKAQPYQVTFSGTTGFSRDGGDNSQLSHLKARQVNEVEKSFEAPVHLQRTASSGKNGPEYSMNVLPSGIRHSSSGGQYPGSEENSGASWKQGTLPFQTNKTLQNRNLRNKLVGWKNSDLTMSSQKRSMTMIPVNPSHENFYFKESSNPVYGDPLKSKRNLIFTVNGDSPRNSAELILKKNAVQSTISGAGYKEKIQSERTASTKTNETLNNESFKQRPSQELSIIADRVYKIIERKLSIEKDRRGLL